MALARAAYGRAPYAGSSSSAPRISLGQAVETDSANPFGLSVLVGLAVEYDTANIIQLAASNAILWTYHPLGVDRRLQIVFESLVRWLGDEAKAPLVQSPNGRWWRIHISDAGTISATQI